MVNGFEAAMEKAGTLLPITCTHADHLCANPTSNHYDDGNAEIVWRHCLDFLGQNLS